MSDIENLKKIMELAVKADQPRQDIVDRLLRHIADGDAAGFVKTYNSEYPTAGEILRVFTRYTKALRGLRTK